jgi:prepilin-type N-terminal cleavage/methylation domain-containing protein
MKMLVCRGRGAFTLIELLITLAIISILATIAIMQYQRAAERALMAQDQSQLRAIGIALMGYHADQGEFPPADRVAGPFMSHGPEFVEVGNGPAAGGSWDGIPWLLLEQAYLSNPESLFCPRYVKLYAGGTTISGEHARWHNFRYAYNSSAMSSGGATGGSGDIETGTVWLVRDLYLDARQGFYGSSWPRYPADYQYPWGWGKEQGTREFMLDAGHAVELVIGGTSTPAPVE